MKLIKGIKKGDILLVLFLVLLCVIWFIPKETKGEITAEIFLEGEKVHSAVLSEINEKETVKIEGCEILLEKDGVTFLHSDCSDKLCEKRGKMTRSGDAMACVPQRVVIVLSSQNKAGFDSVAY